MKWKVYKIFWVVRLPQILKFFSVVVSEWEILWSGWKPVYVIWKTFPQFWGKKNPKPKTHNKTQNNQLLIFLQSWFNLLQSLQAQLTTLNTVSLVEFKWNDVFLSLRAAAEVSFLLFVPLLFPFLCLTGCSNTTEVLCKQCQRPGIKFHQWARSAVSPLLQVGWETSLCLHLSGWDVPSLFLCVHEIRGFAAMWARLKFGLVVFLVLFGLVRVSVVSVLASDCPSPGCCIPVWVCASSCHSWSLDYLISQWQN